MRPTPAAERSAAYLLRLSSRLTPALRKAINATAVRLTPAQTRDLLVALAAGDVERAVAVVWDDPAVQAAWRNVASRYAQSAMVASTGHARAVSVQLGLVVPPPVVSPALLQRIQQWEHRAFRRIQQDVRAGLRQAVANVLADQQGPKAAIARLRPTMQQVGLTAYDRDLIDSMRRSLTEDPQSALRRRLRDRRFDATLRRGAKLSPETIDRMVAGYERKLSGWRSETFARSAALQAANDGQYAAWHEAVASGAITDVQQVRRYWIVSEDERLCPTCSAIPDLNPNGVALDEPFDTPVGRLDGPIAHPNCRCSTWIRIERANFLPRPTPGLIRTLAPPAQRS